MLIQALFPIRKQIATAVDRVMQCIDVPFAIDLQAGEIRYCLPAAPDIDLVAEAVLPPHTPAWYIILRNLPLLGHPIIHAALECEEEYAASYSIPILFP